jgi:hypothetical protein
VHLEDLAKDDSSNKHEKIPRIDRILSYFSKTMEVGKFKCIICEQNGKDHVVKGKRKIIFTSIYEAYLVCFFKQNLELNIELIKSH